MKNVNFSEINQVLTHAIIAYDRRQSKGKYYNMYALPQYLTALKSYMSHIQGIIPNLNLINELEHNFNDRLLANLQKALTKHHM